MMDSNLNLEFCTESSLVFTSQIDSKYIEIHVHMSRYNVIYITLSISDKGICMLKSVKLLRYIDQIMSELRQKLCQSFLGVLNKDVNIEVELHVHFNSIRLHFLPWLINDDDYKKVTGNLSELIFKEIQKLSPSELY